MKGGLAFLLVVVLAGPAVGSEPVQMHPGPGGDPLEVPSQEGEIWLQVPDLAGNLASSEIIEEYDLDTEIANDFVVEESVELTTVVWWGGYWNGYTEPAVTEFMLRIYEEGDECVPGSMIAEYSFPHNCEETVVQEPLFRYQAEIPPLLLRPGTRYWISMIGTHGFPPQWGLLATEGWVECESVFRSEYFSYPDWIPAGGWFVFDSAFALYGEGVATEACCLPDGTCILVLVGTCDAHGGEGQGEGTLCDPNPCHDAAGACCFADGHCEILDRIACASYDGDWVAEDSVCDSNPCPQPRQACCFADGSCTDVPVDACEDAGGTPQGAGTNCNQAACKAPDVGACCRSDGSCAVSDQAECEANQGTYYAGVPCAPNPCVVPVQHTSWGRVKALFR
ncbi:MAG: hypothetical protein GF346_05495 [Candidatus Eisenbacteria bacterium]|nr:hypothetical protein [Candidatus Latescibacterota bacterium]MBD3301882.1 hypothetical protein [Candidatus Eisenbacteria bacterium]